MMRKAAAAVAEKIIENPAIVTTVAAGLIGMAVYGVNDSRENQRQRDDNAKQRAHEKEENAKDRAQADKQHQDTMDDNAQNRAQADKQHQDTMADNAQNRAQADRHHQDTMADNEKQRAHEKESRVTNSEGPGEASGEIE